MTEETYDIRTTIMTGIVCSKCGNELPPMTILNHLESRFDTTCPHNRKPYIPGTWPRPVDTIKIGDIICERSIVDHEWIQRFRVHKINRKTFSCEKLTVDGYGQPTKALVEKSELMHLVV